MNNQRSKNLSLDEFLITVNTRDLDGNRVVPKDDVCEKLSGEIERRTGIKSSNLAGENAKIERLRQLVSAKPGEFITQTGTAVDGLCALLKEKGATAFEVAFHNTKLPPNELGHEVLLAVRYIGAA